MLTNTMQRTEIFILLMLLIEASKQWPSQKDEYQTQSKAILQDILKYNYNENTGILTVGNWANRDSKLL